MVSVHCVTPEVPHYRIPFHNGVWERLRAAGIDYRVAFAKGPTDGNRSDHLPWACETSALAFGKLEWVSPGTDLRNCDLVVVDQHNAILSNYPILLSRLWNRKMRTAYFGHGRNFQSTNPQSAAEQFKRFWINKVDWWFAYTDRSADIVAAAGFPRERITVFDNAIDTSSILRQLQAIDPSEQAMLAETLVEGSRNVGVYISRLYDMKRVPFIIESARRVRSQVPDFHLIVIGEGPDEHLVREAAATDRWIHPLGANYGAKKTRLAALGRVLLMPGLVGLSVLDSFAYGLPMVTTDYPRHSPEFAYLENGRNGIVVPGEGTVETYAAAVVTVLSNDGLRERLRTGAAAALSRYTIENMSRRFAEGVLKALAA